MIRQAQILPNLELATWGGLGAAVQVLLLEVAENSVILKQQGVFQWILC